MCTTFLVVISSANESSHEGSDLISDDAYPNEVTNTRANAAAYGCTNKSSKCDIVKLLTLFVAQGSISNFCLCTLYTLSFQPTNPPTTGPPSKPPTPSPTKKPTTGAPSKSPTPNPTPAPTENNIIMYTGQYYVDWSVGNGRCVRDCDGPRPCGGKKDPWEAGFATESVCCSTMSYKPYSECTYAPAPTPAPITPNTTPLGNPTRQPTNKPTAPRDTRWYNADSTCKNDGNGPSWSNKYSLQSTCCSSHFSWDYNNCMGIENSGTGAWYIDWGVGKCVQDCKTSQGGSCGGLVPGSWILTHTSAKACCTAHMSYASDKECIYNP